LNIINDNNRKTKQILKFKFMLHSYQIG